VEADVIIERVFKQVEFVWRSILVWTAGNSDVINSALERQ